MGAELHQLSSRDDKRGPSVSVPVQLGADMQACFACFCCLERGLETDCRFHTKCEIRENMLQHTDAFTSSRVKSIARQIQTVCIYGTDVSNDIQTVIQTVQFLHTGVQTVQY